MKTISVQLVLDFLKKGVDLKGALETYQKFGSEKIAQTKLLSVLRQREKDLTPIKEPVFISKKNYTDRVCPGCKEKFNTWGHKIYCKASCNPSVKERKRLSKQRGHVDAKPPWMSWKEISEVYLNRPKGFHVDHIVPLNHPDVCGLHVPWNLQYLSPEENIRKSNRWDGTYDNLQWKET